MTTPLPTSTIHPLTPQPIPRLAAQQLFTWGLGRDGALGHGDKQTQKEPKQVSDERQFLNENRLDICLKITDKSFYEYAWDEISLSLLGMIGAASLHSLYCLLLTGSWQSTAGISPIFVGLVLELLYCVADALSPRQTMKPIKLN